MSSRKNLGLLAIFDNSWMGGVYYIANIIRALGFMPDEDQPKITLFYGESTPLDIYKQTNYPNLSLVPIYNSSLFSKVINKIMSTIKGHNHSVSKAIEGGKTDALYPLIKCYPEIKTTTPLFYWIYDFQHKFLPEYFTASELDHRDSIFMDISESADHIVFSSETAIRHFRKFYPGSNAIAHCLPFLSILNMEEIGSNSIEEVRQRYGLGDKPFFLVSNQFWQHKNHDLVIKALGEIKSDQFNVVFTGLESDPRNPEHIDELDRLVSKLGVTNLFRLGLIPRLDQLALLKNCVAAIQPSRFEGWNTFIEDAKALNIPILASNLDVHKEQLPGNSYFFDPDDASTLAKYLQEFLLKDDLPEQGIDELIARQQSNAHNFGRKILEIFT